MLGNYNLITVLLVFGNWINHGQGQEVHNITSILIEPYLMLKENHPNLEGNEKYIGFAKDLADLLQRELGFTYVLKHVKDNKHGHLFRNGTWNGMIRELVDKEADMAIAPITISRERIEAVDFTTPFIEFQFGILMKKPNVDSEGNPLVNDEDADFYVFLKPMTGMLWLAFILVTIFLIIFFYLIEFIVSKKMSLAKSKKQGATSALPSQQLTPTCANGICGTPKSTAGRFLQVIFWIYIFIFVAAYIAAFSASRIVDRMDEDEQSYIETVEDFVTEKDLVYGVVRAGSTFEFFQHSSNPLYAKMYQMMLKRKDKEPKSLKADLAKGVEAVRNGNGTYAFIMESQSAYYEASRKPCDLYVVPELFGPKRGFGVATTKDHPLKVSINIGILALKEKGDLETLENKWFSGRGECSNENSRVLSEVEQYGSLTLEEMAGLFFILVSGIIIGIILAGIELLMSKKNAKNENPSVMVPLRENA